MNRSTYTVTTITGFICLTDSNLPGIKSVTNDAEHVIEDLLTAGFDLDANRVLYCDSDGVWDELVVRKGRFAGFHSLNAKDLDEAYRIAYLREPDPEPPDILGTGL
jgi:hypothetical protein